MCTASCAGFIDPIHAYPHDGESSAVTGGPIYRGDMFPPEYQGDLFFGDYAKGFIKHADLDANGDVTAVQDFDDQAGSVVDLKVAPDGSLYYITYYPGALLPRQLQHAVAPAGGQRLRRRHQGRRAAHGALLERRQQRSRRRPAELPLGPRRRDDQHRSRTRPRPTRRGRLHGAAHRVGGRRRRSRRSRSSSRSGCRPSSPSPRRPRASCTGRATRSPTTRSPRDAAGFDLDDGDIKTEVRLHHGTHFHPFVGPLTGRAGSFTIPTTGEASADTSYEVKVTATDGNGLSASKVVNVLPRKSDISLATSPPGLGLFVDGIPVSTPAPFTGVEGFQRELYAPLHAVAQDGTAAPVRRLVGRQAHPPRHHARRRTTPPTRRPTSPSQPFTATYYDNTTFSGTPVLTRQDPDDQLRLGRAARRIRRCPPTSSRPAGPRRSTSARAATRSRAVADDGVRLYIDGQRVINRWQGPANTEFSYTVDLGEGLHTIKLDYVELRRRRERRSTWDSALDQPAGHLPRGVLELPAGHQRDPRHGAELARDEEAIDHDWGDGSPGPGIAANQFSPAGRARSASPRATTSSRSRPTTASACPSTACGSSTTGSTRGRRPTRRRCRWTAVRTRS